MAKIRQKRLSRCSITYKFYFLKDTKMTNRITSRFERLWQILTVALLIVFPSELLVSQTPDSVVNKSVTVTRDYQPVITDVGKVITAPKIVEPSVNKTKPIYSNIATPLSVDYSIHTLPAEELLHTPQSTKPGFLRLGMGFPLNSLADFMYPVLNDERNRLDVSLHHLGAFMDKKHSKTTLSVMYNHLFSKFDLYAGVGGSHDYFNYYGSPFASSEPFIMAEYARQDRFGQTMYRTPENNEISLYNISGLPLDNTHWRAGVTVGGRSLPLADNLIFDASLNYRLLNNVSNKISENQILLKGLFEVPFDLNRLGMDVFIYNFSYSGTDISYLAFPDNYSVIKLNPYYKLVGDSWYLRLGAKTGISIGGAGQIFSPSADVSGQWNAVSEYLALYAGVTGDLTVNSWYNIYDENRYLSSHIRIKDTYSPVDAYLGVKVSPVYNLLFDVYGQYKIISNQYFYINRPYERTGVPLPDLPGSFDKLFHNRFDVVYSHADRASVGARASWDFKNQINVYAKAAHHFWNVKEEAKAWHLPSWDMDFGASIKVGNDIAVNTQFYFQDGRYAKLSDAEGTLMTPVFDWNIGGSYAYRDWLSMFVRVNNILNKKYEFYKGYEVQGINGMVGVAFSF